MAVMITSKAAERCSETDGRKPSTTAPCWSTSIVSRAPASCFPKALWSLERRSARTRQRNVCSCRNALNVALRNVDAYDLIDAYDYAEKFISNLF